MNYVDLLSSKGWLRSPACGVCRGMKKYTYTNANRPNEVVEVLYTMNLFRYKIGNTRVSGGSLASLEFQHFMQ
jgi:hypothetical protein